MSFPIMGAGRTQPSPNLTDCVDSCSLLPSDWLASKEGPGGMQNRAPAANLPGTAGKGAMNTAFLNPGAGVASSNDIPLLKRKTKCPRNGPH